MKNLEKDDLFEVWLIHMDDAIQNLINSLPNELGSRLDYSPESLDSLEAWLLEKYSSVLDALSEQSNTIIDGASRYVGETLRKNLGGTWFINNTDEKLLYFGVPQLQNMRGQRIQISPLAMVTTSLDRRRGTYLRMILANMANRA
ncbi:hypothetical protein J3P71_30785 (plasmid) [Rhizobium leguminosarum]|uniref:hypothetical protein n=1 Tax=Rhizobium leguminosarum TaxID=384 RepID=UPI0014411230|nr:hypothetical protein [Rhizobium leguminosarum]MBY5835535.1 hypothetical protein [Rhizobium leguminosarum]NKM78172.1 hypothetical protein [Rhizobium leguminosarum bv. viciae]QSZ11623.1 hypothetical protein J3P71_30785 [Rhizobium leguminosarum]